MKKRETNRIIPEKDFRQTVIDAAKLYGWCYYFTWNSLHSPAGFPDFVLVRGTRLIMAELKSAKGKPTEAQQEWLDMLKGTGKCEVYVWRPSDFDRIIAILSTDIIPAVEAEVLRRVGALLRNEHEGWTLIWEHNNNISVPPEVVEAFERGEWPEEEKEW